MFLGLDGLAGKVGVAAKYMPTGHLLWNLVGHHSRVEAIPARSATTITPSSESPSPAQPRRGVLLMHLGW
jgi:hypothetical protein